MYFRVLLTFLLFLSLAGCDNSVNVRMSHEEGNGVFPQRVVFGSSLALKGHAGYLGNQTLRGAMAYIKHVNNQGGVHGRRIEVVAYDDSYDPPRCLSNTQKLIVEDRVFALFDYVGTPTTVKVLPMVEDAKVPLLGMFTGANALRVPFNRYLINVRPSYYQETGEAVRHMVDDLGLDRIAVFYQYDAYGFDGLTGTELALKQYGLAPVARGSYIRGTLDVDDGLERIVRSDAQAVFLVGTAKPCARFMEEARKKDFNPVYYMVSFVGADEFMKQLGRRDGFRVLMSQVVPPFDSSGSIHSEGSEYVRLLRMYYPNDRPNMVGLEGFFNAKVLVEGLRRAGRDLTREKFIDSIESMDDHQIAPGINVSFGNFDHQGMDRVYFTRLERGGFVQIRDWKSLRESLK